MILAIDPGIGKCGWAIVRPRTARVIALGVIVTKPTDGASKSADRAHRIGIVATDLRAIASTHSTTHIAAEAMLFHGRINAVVSQVLCWGMLVGLAVGMGDTPVHSVTAKEWQHGVMEGCDGAIEYDAVFQRLSVFVESQLPGALARITGGLRTHALDAVGVGMYAALSSSTAVTLVH